MIVEVEGQEIEFPDSMSREQIASVLRQKFPPKQAAPNIGELARAGGVPLPQLRNVLNTATFGLGDEIESLFTSTPAAQVRAERQQFGQEYPAASVLSDVSGGLLGGSAGGAALKGATSAVPAIGRVGQVVKETVPRWAQFVGGGAGAGGLYGAGDAEPGERVSGAITGGLKGAAGAGLLVGGAAVSAKAYETILKPLWQHVASTPTKSARRLIEETLAQSGMTPQQALKALQESGDETMMLDLSPHLRDLAYDARAGIGPGRTIIDDALKNRQVGQQNRLALSSGQALGAYADDARDFVTNITKAQSEQARPLYEAAHQQNIRTNPEFVTLWEEAVPKSAIKKAKEIARKEWYAGLIKPSGQTKPNTLDDAGGLLSGGPDNFDFDALPDVLRVDYVKRAWDDRIAAQLRAGERQSARADIALRNKVLDFVDKQVPEFKKARGVWAGAEQLKNAAEFGKDVFKQDADDLADIVARYGESEQQAFRYGVSQAIRDTIESTGSATADATRKLAGSAKNRRIIKAAFGNAEEFNRFMKQIEREGVYRESLYEVTGNSKTAERIARKGDRMGDIPEPSSAGLFTWLARHFGPQDPLRNPETNRLVSEWLTKGGYGLLDQAPPAQPGQGLMVVPQGSQVAKRGLL